MGLSNTEVEKVNALYRQLDVMTLKYNNALEDIQKLTSKITDYADALAEKCTCTCNKKPTVKRTTKSK